MAKPNWQPKQRDGNRGRGRDYHDSPRDNVIFHPTSNRRPDRPRQDNAKPQVAKQGVKGALRAANLRLLLENAPVPEAMALVAEVPLERLEAMSQGALCPDETAFHIERTLKLPGKWLDGLNKEVPARTLHLLKNPEQAELQDDEDVEEDVAPSSPVVSPASAQQPAAQGAATSQPAPASTKLAPQAQQVQDAIGEAAAAVEPSSIAASTEAGETAHAAADPAVDAAPEGLQAAGKRAAAAHRRASAAAEVQLHLSELAPPSQSGPNETSPMAFPELRKQNLTVLLQGKGARSALARILHAKPPYVSAMVSGRKSLDKELCNGMARALGLPENWFESPRTAADIPAAVLQRLVSLRDAGTAASSSDTAEAAPASTAGSGTAAADTPAADESSERVASQAGTAEGDTATPDAAIQIASVKPTQRRARHASQAGDQPLVEPMGSVDASTSAPAAMAIPAELPAPVEPEVQPAAQEAAPALRTEVLRPQAPVLDAAPVAAATSPQRAALQTIDYAPVYSQPLVIEGGLAPITEALIKILVLKARQGALSEDKAFELLGEARLL